MNKSGHSRTRSALTIFVASFLVSFLIGFQEAAQIPDGSHPFGWIFLSQSQNILMALVLASFVYFAWEKPLTRILAIGFSVFVNLLVLCDWVAFKLYFQHFQLSMGDGGIPPFQLLFDSFFAEFDRTLGFDTVFAICLAAGTFFFTPKFFYSKRMLRWASSILIVWVLIGFVARGKVNDPALTTHPLVSLIESSWSEGKVQSTVDQSNCTANKTEKELYSLWQGKQDGLSPGMLSAEQKWRAIGKARPNIILIVLESVGSVSALSKNGDFDPEITPNLYAISREGVTFTRLYDTYPGTMRSHVPLHTGGSTITSGSAYHEFSAHYDGLTLESGMHKAGYQNALFSAQYMEFENLEGFYSHLPFDFVMTPKSEEASGAPLPKLNSWGVEEGALEKRIETFLNRKVAGKPAPFLLEFLSQATHHPYGFTEAFAPRENLAPGIKRYHLALRYTDAMIGRVVEALKARGIWDNTIVAVMGDHGEAFGDRHPKDVVHGNFLYEDNIRNFLTLRAPGISFVQDARPAFIGDVAPTLLALALEESSHSLLTKMRGQDLMDSRYESKIRYFHKNVTPERWGLVDGNWKYIGSRLSLDHLELYDLERDPEEQVNLAAEYPDRVAEYECRDRQWYLDTQEEYLTHLPGFAPLAHSKNDFRFTKSSGLRMLNTGVHEDDGTWKFQTHFKSGVAPFVQVDYAPLNEAKTFELTWISPDGKLYRDVISLPMDVNRMEARIPQNAEIIPGNWRVEARSHRDGAPEVETAFVVE